MGTDIHPALEIKRDGKWEPIMKPNIWYNDKWAEEDNEPEFSPEFEEARDRNYDAFAILADVRNGTGFAGVITGSGFDSISKPKGLPLDISPEVASYIERSGDHSHSYVTLKELLSVDWFKTSKHVGWVNAISYYSFQQRKQWDKFKGPESYSGDISGPNIQHISNEEMDRLIQEVLEEAKASSENGRINPYSVLGKTGPFVFQDRENTPEKLLNKFTAVKWEELYSESAGKLYTRAIPAMKQLGDPEDVRMVFAFDS